MTERPEGMADGTLKLVGTAEGMVYSAFKQLLDNQNEYDKMSKTSNSYDDFTSKRIADVLEHQLSSYS